MGKIYEHSLRTLVWLGVDNDGVAVELAEFLKEISQTAAELIKKYGTVTKIPNLSKEENPVRQDPEKWAIYKTFLDFTWFTRAWVMQEVGIAPQVSIFWVRDVHTYITSQLR
jgi:hypothetical protein